MKIKKQDAGLPGGEKHNGHKGISCQTLKNAVKISEEERADWTS